MLKSSDLVGKKIGPGFNPVLISSITLSPAFYYILHVVSILVLTGYTFYAFAAAPETRKKVMIITGVASLLVLVGGFGLQAKLAVGWPG